MTYDGLQGHFDKDLQNSQNKIKLDTPFIEHLIKQGREQNNS